ncbi:MAG: aldo/keto reductase, partial [Bdellovibrionaceae bacterium]|nr:aldo/keto reductase [Pseudobdellovibrionaceae bacterium]
VPGNHGGESETILGNWMKARGNRNKLVIATKLGMEMGPHKKGLKKDYMLSAVEASLTRLQTDRIDLYIAHRDDEETPLEETLEMFGHLIVHGKVRVAGASNYTSKRLRHALEVSHKNAFPAYQSLQPHYNMYDRKDFEKDLLAVCEENQLGVTPYFALASGFLTGKYRSEKDFSKSSRGNGAQKYMDERGMKILNALDRVAKEHRSTPTSVALSWLMAKPYITAPIASATSPEQMKDLIAAISLTLDPPSMELLDSASDPGMY